MEADLEASTYIFLKHQKYAPLKPYYSSTIRTMPGFPISFGKVLDCVLDQFVNCALDPFVKFLVSALIRT